MYRPNLVSTRPPDSSFETVQPPVEWGASTRYYVPVFPRPSTKSLVLAIILFLLTLGTSLAAGTQFAASYGQNKAVSFDELTNAYALFYKNPAGLLAGLPFAATLLTIWLSHELGHFFACRHHHIHSSYPFFVPFPSLTGTFGAFILMRSPIRTARALFDVGASGPLVGFVFAVPALIFGVMHAKVVPGITDLSHVELVFGTPLLLRFFAAVFHPGVAPTALLLHPVGRAAWVGLFATSLNLLPVGQLDGGHILRSLNARIHRITTSVLPLLLLPLGKFFWVGWYVWAALLFLLSFLRIAPIHDPVPLDPLRSFGALLTLAVFILCFMPAPFFGL